MLTLLAGTALLMLGWIIANPPEGSFSSRDSIFDNKFNMQASNFDVFSIPEANETNFPYSAYQLGIREKGFSAYEQDIQLLDIQFPDLNYAGQQIIYNALADSLEPYMAGLYASYMPDSLLLLLEWVIPFKEYAKINPNHALVYNAVHSFWMNKTALALSQFAQHDPNLPYQFKFQYLAELCARNTFQVNIKETRLEKFQKNLLAGHWNHLISASWHDAPIWGKVLFFFLLLLTITAYIILFQHIFQLFKKK